MSANSPSINPLSFTGVLASQPPNLITNNRAPLSTDTNATPGDIWRDTSVNPAEFWILSVLFGGSATWLPLSGGNVASQFQVDTAVAPGTDPTIPVAGVLTLTGAQVASGTSANAIRTSSLADGSVTFQIQRSASAASSTVALNGISHFNSSQFSVDSDGFVSLVGGGAAVDSFLPDTGTSPVVPDGSGQVSITGQATPNVSGIQVTGGLNSLGISMFSPFQGNFDFTLPTSGATQKVLIEHTSDTAGSNAQQIISVAGTSAGDAWNQWTVGSTTSWSLGIDNSDSDELKINYSASSSVSPSTGTELVSISPTNMAVNTTWSFSHNGNLAAGSGCLGLFSNSGGGAYRLSIDTNATGDPYILFDLSIGGAGAWEVGINNVANLFQINYGPNAAVADMSGSVGFSMANNGEITFNSAYSFPLADGTAGQTLVTDGAGQLSFASNSAIMAYTNVTTTPYVVLSTDEFLSVDTSTAKTIQLPNAATAGRIYVVKDRTGNAAANNITVTTVGGAVNIDGAVTYLITVNYGAVCLMGNGTSYEVY